MDVSALKLDPTWRNKRGGDKAISKRLDHFMVEEKLLNGNLILKSIIEIGGNSDHRPVSLIISPHKRKPKLSSNLTLYGWKRMSIKTK